MNEISSFMLINGIRDVRNSGILFYNAAPAVQNLKTYCENLWGTNSIPTYDSFTLGICVLTHTNFISNDFDAFSRLMERELLPVLTVLYPRNF